MLLALLFEALDVLIDHELYTRFDNALTERGRLLATELMGTVPPGRRTSAGWPEFRAGSHTDFFQLWDSDGRTLARSPSSGTRDLAPPPQKPVRDPVLYDLALPDGHRGRAAALPTGGGGEGAVFVVAAEREALDALERRIHFALIATIGIVLALVVSLSIAAVHRALRPLADFGADAERRSRNPDEDGRDLRTLPQELQPIAAALDRAFTRLTAMLLRERRFARDLAHELRTPLAEMFALVETMPAPNEAIARQRTQIAHTLTGMTRIVDGLLALARYEAGIDQPAIEPVEFVALVRAQMAVLARAAAEREIELDATLPDEAWVMSDELLLERIVSNLVGNAIAHAPTHSRVHLRCATGAASTSFVIDNAAPQLTAEDLARLGDRHFRPTHATAAGEHAGLGLALCAALADRLALTLQYSLHEGRLAVELAGLKALETTA